MSRPAILDEIKRAEVCALLAAGCSQQAAARYVGVTPTAIRNAARRDPDFFQQLLKAMRSAELDPLQNIRAASAKSWRAAAWLLERAKPQQYGYRNARQLNADFWGRFVEQMIEFTRDLLPDAKSRYEFCRRMDRLIANAQTDTLLPFPFSTDTPPDVPPDVAVPTDPHFLDAPTHDGLAVDRNRPPRPNQNRNQKP